MKTRPCIECGFPAAYGCWCLPCCQDRDPHWMTTIDWDTPLEDPDEIPTAGR